MDRTAAYPEGGRQEGDRGGICAVGNAETAFVDTRRKFQRAVDLPWFGDFTVDRIVFHVPAERVTVNIDVRRRERLSASHTAAYLLYLSAQQVRPDLPHGILGCHITEELARLDFSTDDKITVGEVAIIADFAAGPARRRPAVTMPARADKPQARCRKCGGRAGGLRVVLHLRAR